MLNTRKITDLISHSTEIFTESFPAAGISYHDTTLLMSGLSRTCTSLNEFFKKPLEYRMLLKLCQAVIDDNREQARNILHVKPGLLLMQPPLKSIIESKFTFQRFYAEAPLLMAAKRKQIEMMKLMLDCCDQSLRTDAATLAKKHVLSAWSPPYSIQQNGPGKEEMVIPADYAKFAKELVDVFRVENFPQGKLSKKTKSTLQLLFNTLLPNQAVRLDDYLDVELLLLALYQAYYDHFKMFQDWDQHDVFCVRVIGLVQSVLSPETAKIFCEGLDDGVTALSEGNEKKLSEPALEHLLKDKTPFYRSSRDPDNGLGYDFLCGINGRPPKPAMWNKLKGAEDTLRLWKAYVEQKLQTCRTYTARAKESVSVVCDSRI